MIMFTIIDSPAVETPQGIDAKLAEAKAAITTAQVNYEQAALDGEEGKVSASVVREAEKALQVARRRVGDLTAASAAAEARAERQAAADAEAARASAAAAKVESLEALRVAAVKWDAAVEQLRVITDEFAAAGYAFHSKHNPTQAEHAQLEAARLHTLAIVEHALRNYLGAPTLLPFLNGPLLKIETHIPHAE